jgi:mannose-6-phosphate isomerase-like protein (cupin superfamily)
MADALPAGAAPAVIRPGELPLEREANNPISYRRIIRRDHHGAGISMSWIRLKGRHCRLVCYETDRVYYILTGSAEFRLGEAAAEKAQAGDSVFIPRGTPYDFTGEMDYLVMNGPAFLPDSDVYLD